MKPSRRESPRGTLLGASLAAVAMWLIPGLSLLAVPLQYLNTHLHELFHALAAVGTGGHVAHIRVFADGSGVTPIAGGNTLLIASAGYVGATFLGSLLILSGASERSARLALQGVGAALFAALLIWVRGDVVGVASIIAWAGLLLYAGLRLRGRSLLFVVQFLGLLQCLTALLSLFALLKVSAMPGVHSDAALLAGSTGIPAVVWATLWAAFSLVIAVAALRRAWRRDQAAAAPGHIDS
ncbi:MAG TPA: M50 family metallopeptidase [Fimbriimonadaceae bacterium]|nr:M50 family metallopeptidase [Fimbriimonadaceae bacterium]